MDESIARIEFSKHRRKSRVETVAYAHIEVGLKIWVPRRRPGAHPLDALGEFKDSVVLELRPVTPAQLTFVHGDVFSQAINQPSMQLVNVYLVERFRAPPRTDDDDARDDLAATPAG